MSLALGRLFRLGSRPTQEGDIEEWYRIRNVVLTLGDEPKDHSPNFARDHSRGDTTS
jgi:hypothetical protein